MKQNNCSVRDPLSWGLGKLQRLIRSAKANFPSNHKIMIDSEMVEVMVDFTVRGAWIDDEMGHIVVHVTVERWTPEGVDLCTEIVDELVTVTLNTELRWLDGIPWSLSIDKDSVRRLRRGEKKEKYLQHIMDPIKKRDLKPAEAVEVLSKLLSELRPELKEALTSHGALKKEGLIEIETRGLPCPICLGHLSEEAIYSLFHRLKFEIEDDEY